MASPLRNTELAPTSTAGVPQVEQPHGGRLNTGGTKGNRGHILRRRKQHVAWLAAQRLIERLKDDVQAVAMKDADLINAAKLDGDKLDITSNGETLQVVTVFGGITVQF